VKFVLIIALIAAVGLGVWGFLSMRQLNSTREELAVTQAQLNSTQSDLTASRDELSSIKNQLSSSEATLEIKQNQLAQTEKNLVEARDALNQTSVNLDKARRDLTDMSGLVTTAQLKATTLQTTLAQTQQKLTASQTTLGGLGITVLSSLECYDVNLVDNPAATDPTLDQLKKFLMDDKTENHTYILDTYDCSQFSRDVHNNAEAAGIRAAEVQVKFNNELAGHALNAFLTKDYGLVYIDCTQPPDTIARLEKDKTYRGLEVSNVPAAKIRDNSFWDGLYSHYYFIETSSGSQAITSIIRIYW
jgi:hypothetical protein